jgi:hypothetical protein
MTGATQNFPIGNKNAQTALKHWNVPDRDLDIEEY